MKLLFSLAFVMLLHTATSAQTKKIAYRSHSGKNKNFSLSGIDNFGETPEMIKAWEEIQLEEELKKENKKLEKNGKTEPAKATPEGETKTETSPQTKTQEASKSETEQKVTKEVEPNSSTVAPKTKKELKQEKKMKRKSHKKSIEAKGASPVQTKENTGQSIHQNVRNKESHASVSWLLLLFMIGLPSVVALKSLKVKL